MNEILLKRIVESAENHEQHYNVGEEHGYLYTHKGDIKEAVIYGAIFALQNQWISVEEGLPKEGKLVFMKCKNNDINTFCSGVYEGIKDEWYEDGIGYVDNVTHWMYIPTINNEEK